MKLVEGARVYCFSADLWIAEFIGDDGTVKQRTGETWEAVGRKLARVVRRRGRGL